MDYQNKKIIDASCDGYISSKSETQAYHILEELSPNSFNYSTSCMIGDTGRGCENPRA